MKTLSFGVVSVVAALVCGRLGFWQLDRLELRRAQNSTVEARLMIAPMSVTSALNPSEALPYQRVGVEGVYDSERTIIEVFRSRNGVPGVYVVSPLMLNDSVAVLVERGWAPSQDARTVDVARFVNLDPVSVVGFVRPVSAVDSLGSLDRSWPRYVRSANPDVLAELFPYDLLPVLVRRTGGIDSENLPALTVPAMDEASHLSYAVQWFSFATIALVGGFIWIRKTRLESAG